MFWRNSRRGCLSEPTSPSSRPGSRLARRGATSLLFAVSAAGLLGVAALGTEAGTWYLFKRQGQNAADAAAMAGAVALASSQSAVASGTYAATRNGFTTGTANVTVTINNPPASGPNAGNANAVEAIINKTVNPLVAAMFLPGSVTVANRAVAVLYTDTNGPACVLAYQGLQFQGSTSITAPDCSMASDTSISIGGNASVNAPLYAVSGCSGCSPSDTTYGLPIQAPFAAAIDALTMPPTAFSYNDATTCVKVGNINLSGTTVLPSYDTAGSPANSATSIGGKAYCGMGQGNGTNATLAVSTGNTLTLAPGTYFFWNLNFQVSGGTVQCPTCTGDQGVTLVFLGTSGNTGDISITGGTVILKAPKVNYYNAAFNGILFYRPLATGTGGGIGTTDVTLTGSSTISLSGGMYFPNSSVSMTGDMTAGGATCQEIVGNTITFTGNSTFTETGCSSQGTPVPYPKYVMLLE